MKYRIGNLEFQGRNFLEFSAIIETNERNYPKDVVFVSFYESFRREHPLTMQLRLNDLFAFSEAIKETITRGSNTYEKFTSSGETTTKLITMQDNGRYYIKMIRGERMLSMGFDPYSFRTAHTRLVSLAKLLESMLYKAQRGALDA